jgi:hypothetical protein
MPRRAWTLEAAREMLAEVRSRTERAVSAVETLMGRLEREATPEERVRIQKRVRDRVSQWVREMEALGVDVKGPWLVDFDNGEGCFCWRWPEERLEYFHGHEEGFAGRTRIQ